MAVLIIYIISEELCYLSDKGRFNNLHIMYMHGLIVGEDLASYFSHYLYGNVHIY